MHRGIKLAFLFSCACGILFGEVPSSKAVILDELVFEDAKEAGKWVIKTYRDTYGVMPTPIHVQKLLYYWHAATLVQQQKRLAPLRFEAWLYGSVERRMYDDYPGYPRQPLSALSEKLTPRLPLPNNDVKELLRSTIEYYGRLNTWDISDMNHEEAPWKDVFKPRHNIHITDESIQTYYQRRPMVSEKDIHQKKFEAIFRELQNTELPVERVFDCFREFESIKEDRVFWQFCMADRKYKSSSGEQPLAYHDRFYPFLKWPTQKTLREAVGAFIFFPRDLDHQEDSTIDLYHRGRVLTMLAISASYGSPLALYYLKEAFQFHYQGLESISEEPLVLSGASSQGERDVEKSPRKRAKSTSTHEIKEEIRSLLFNIQQASNLRFTHVIDALPLDVEGPSLDPTICLMVGLCKNFLGDRPGALEAFKKIDFSKSDSHAAIMAKYYRTLLDDQLPLAHLSLLGDAAQVAGYKRIAIAIRLSLAKQPEISVEKRANHYLKARSMGSGRASAALAKLVQDNAGLRRLVPDKTSEDFFREAVENGMMSAYFELVDAELKKEEPNTLKYLGYCKDAGVKGDALGYIRLGNLYEKWNRTKEALERYKLAGPFGWVQAVSLQQKLEEDYSPLMIALKRFLTDLQTAALKPQTLEEGTEPESLSIFVIEDAGLPSLHNQSLSSNEEVLETVLDDEIKRV